MLMNHIGTHDTDARPLPCWLGRASHGRDGMAVGPNSFLRAERTGRSADDGGLRHAVHPAWRALRLLWRRSGMEGYKDPFNRGCYPWGQGKSGAACLVPALGEIREVASRFQRGKLPPAESQRQPAGLRPGGPGRKKPVGSLRLLLRKKSGDSGPASGISKRDRFAGRLLKRPYPDLTRGKLLSDPGGKGSLRFCGGRRAGHEIYVPKAQNQG